MLGVLASYRQLHHRHTTKMNDSKIQAEADSDSSIDSALKREKQLFLTSKKYIFTKNRLQRKGGVAKAKASSKYSELEHLGRLPKFEMLDSPGFMAPGSKYSKSRYWLNIFRHDVYYWESASFAYRLLLE